MHKFGTASFGFQQNRIFTSGNLHRTDETEAIVCTQEQDCCDSAGNRKLTRYAVERLLACLLVTANSFCLFDCCFHSDREDFLRQQQHPCLAGRDWSLHHVGGIVSREQCEVFLFPILCRSFTKIERVVTGEMSGFEAIPNNR